MAGLKLYFDLMSQPARAVFIFLKINGIPFEEKPVALRKGEHFSEEYRKINPFGLVPVIDDSGFILTERQIPSQVIRQHCACVDKYQSSRVVDPRATNKPVNEARLASYKSSLDIVLDNLENVFLKNHPYLCGDDITIGDILGICELMQPYSVGVELGKGRPHLAAYIERVKQRLQPTFDEAHIMVYKVKKVFGQQNTKL